MIFRPDGQAVDGAGQRSDFNGFDMTSNTGPTESDVSVQFGDRAVQVGGWRISDIDSDHLSVTNESGDVSRIYRSDGTVYGNNRDYSGFEKELGEPNCAYLSEKYLRLGDWRFGALDNNHLSVTHKDGKTAVVYRNDGTAHGGPRDDWNAWDLPAGNVIMGDRSGCPPYQYLLGDKGPECPQGRDISSLEECEEAGSQLGLGPVTSSAGWSFTPCGCFMWGEHADDNRLHFDGGSSACVSSDGRNKGMVCKTVPFVSCGSDSDGSAGNLEFDISTGQLTLNGSPISLSLGNGNTLGTAYDAVTTIYDVDQFIIPAGATVYAVGTVKIYSRRAVIDGTLDGNGRGYPGAAASTTASGARALSGESPSGTNGYGRGGKSASGRESGGGGGSHGTLLVFLLM